MGIHNVHINNLLNTIIGFPYGAAKFKSPQYLRKKIGITMVDNKNIVLHTLYFDGKKRFFPLIQYPIKKNGRNENVLWRDKNLSNGRKPANKLIINVDVMISFVLFKILLGMIWSNTLQYNKLRRYHNTHHGVNTSFNEIAPVLAIPKPRIRS